MYSWWGCLRSQSWRRQRKPSLTPTWLLQTMRSYRPDLLDQLLHPPSAFESAVAYRVFVDIPKCLYPKPRASAVLSWQTGALGPSVNAGALPEVAAHRITLGSGLCSLLLTCWISELGLTILFHFNRYRFFLANFEKKPVNVTVFPPSIEKFFLGCSSRAGWLRTWALDPDQMPLLTSCVTPGKLLDFFVPLFLHLQNWLLFELGMFYLSRVFALILIFQDSH